MIEIFWERCLCGAEDLICTYVKIMTYSDYYRPYNTASCPTMLNEMFACSLVCVCVCVWMISCKWADCESYRRVRGTSSWAALLWQRRQLSRQTERSRGTPHRPHTHTHHNDRTAGMDPGSPGSGTDWTHLTSSPHMPPLQIELKDAGGLQVTTNILWWCVYVS